VIAWFVCAISPTTFLVLTNSVGDLKFAVSHQDQVIAADSAYQAAISRTLRAPALQQLDLPFMYIVNYRWLSLTGFIAQLDLRFQCVIPATASVIQQCA
jgi:hypothetical protein